MKGYFAYVRVSTVKQGEKGSSLQEQRTAIENYARRVGLTIAEWFEEKETAAKQGRPVFLQMIKALQNGLAVGVITHKIDRSARNLRDWAALGELLDRGIELHFAHESIDLNSRGGRLSADIQAVVAADYVRNLRDEVRKGFYGRLKQGLYPLRAPLGYLDQGGGEPKTIDPISGPLVRKAFELYATGALSLDSLATELFDRGLRSRFGRRVTANGLSTVLNNPFYFGLMRIRRELYQGIHQPLISKDLFDRVRAVLRGRVPHRGRLRRFRYQRMIRCCSCDRSLIASRKKGHVYYRCHTKTCPTTCIREELVDQTIWAFSSYFRLSDLEWKAVRRDIDTTLAHQKIDLAEVQRSVELAINAIDDRLGRLTDVLVDGAIDRETYVLRKDQLLNERISLVSRKEALAAGDAGFRDRVEEIVELIKALGHIEILANDEKMRDLLKTTTSNLTACGKNVAIAWESPFDRLVSGQAVTVGGPLRGKPRTTFARVNHVLTDYCTTFTENVLKRGASSGPPHKQAA